MYVRLHNNLFQSNYNVLKFKTVSRIHKMTFYLNYIIKLFDGSKLIKTEIILKSMLNTSKEDGIADSTPNL
jgi:hypothetical protein